MEYNKIKNKITVQKDIDVLELLNEIPLEVLKKNVKKRINENAESEIEAAEKKRGISNSYYFNHIRNDFWQILKNESDKSYVVFYIRKKDHRHFEWNLRSFTGVNINYRRRRNEELIKCQFPNGYNNYSNQFEHIYDAIKIAVFYSSEEDLIELGMRLQEKDIHIITAERNDVPSGNFIGNNEM